MPRNAPPRIRATAAAPRKAEPVHLTRGLGTQQAFGLIARACVAHIAANRAAARAGRDPEGVHQLRVGIRRLRAALSVFRDALAKPERERLVRNLRWLHRRLAAARAWDVFIADVLTAEASPDASDPARDTVMGLAEKQRAKAYARCRAALDEPRCAALLTALRDALAPTIRVRSAAAAVTARDPAIPGFAAAALRRRHRQLRKLGKRHGKLDEAQLHALRIRAKRLRYTLEFFADLWRIKRTQPHIDALETLQDRLGRVVDGFAARDLLRALKASAGPAEAKTIKRLQRQVAARRRALRKQIAAPWRRLAALKPFWKPDLPDA